MKKTSVTIAALAALLLSSGRCLEAQPAPLEDAQFQLRQAQEQLARAAAEAQRSLQLAQKQAHSTVKEALESAKVQQLVQLAQAAALAPNAPRPPEPPEPPAAPSEALALEALALEGDEVSASRNAALAAYELGHQLHGTGPALIVSPARAEAGEVAQVEEDLAVMSRILEKAVERVSGREAAQSVLGINLSHPFAFRRSQSLYLDGYGVLFVLNVKCPLLVAPGKEEVKEDKPDNSTWEQTKRELYGRGQPPILGEIPVLGALFKWETDRATEQYDASKVESLKKGLVEALNNGTNIRHLKDDDTLAVVVLGPPAAQTRRGEARNEGGRSRRRAQATAGDTRPTTLAIRVKKSEVDAFAQGKLTADEFAKKAAIALY